MRTLLRQFSGAIHLMTLTVLFVSTVDNKSGDVCISILHDPGEDKFGYERPEERWLPIHTVETILVSVISMLADPNDESPANLDAAVSIASISNFNIKYIIIGDGF